MLSSGVGYANHFMTIFSPLASEYDLIGKHPEAADTVKNITLYQNELEDLKSQVTPELELIESRVVGPVKELQALMKTIRKGITKRDHKVSATS